MSFLLNFMMVFLLYHSPGGWSSGDWSGDESKQQADFFIAFRQVERYDHQ
jgi:hypothetical protein